MVLFREAWANTLQSKTGVDENGTEVQENDHRFNDQAWNTWPFKALKEGFKASESWWQKSSRIDGMSSHHQQLVHFFTSQWLDAISPSNWPLTNPEVIEKSQESNGDSLLQGQKNYLRDMQEHYKACAAMSSPKQLYEVGKDVAATPGKVVFRNRLVELIQYTPTTDKVLPEPLLIVPSCIMKYYILDLSPTNSMVRYLVGQGYTVFMISWRNPDVRDRDLGMQDYLQMGVMEAMAAVKSLTNAPRIHAMGYCLGGTFLAIVASALGRQKNAARLEYLPKLASVTLLASLTDFSEPGELGIFIDEDQIQTLRQTMAQTGYMSGRQMGGAFQFLNSRELIWSRQTHRYLLGEDEMANDLLSWNTDVTRLTERMHSEYLSSLYLDNALVNGHYHVAGMGVALMDIKGPMLVVGTARDHVSPWRSVYKIHLHTDTHTTFILAAGGHNAGIISEPGHARRSYQLDSVEPGHDWEEPDEWIANAPVSEGSWWPATDIWLKKHSGAPVPAHTINPDHVLGDAPGDYVHVRYAD
jgi:polyhydroxyalkanoate synthase